MTIDTDRWKLIKAKWYTKTDPAKTRAVRLVVVHCMESLEKGSTAEDVAQYFADLPASTKASAHICIDSNSVVQCVLDNDVAYAAPGANHDGIQIEFAGYARQTADQWLDAYGIDMLELGSNVVAQYCLKYDIPVRRLTNEQLADGKSKGLVSHAQVSQVFKKSDHTDPGPNFPWLYFLKLVQAHATARAAMHAAGVPTPAAMPLAAAQGPPPRIVWSNHFDDYLVVTRYVSDRDWSFMPLKSLVKMGGTRAQTPLSAMPLKRP